MENKKLEQEVEDLLKETERILIEDVAFTKRMNESLNELEERSRKNMEALSRLL